MRADWYCPHMKYLISNYGAGIAVGLIESEGAQEDMNLAHNIFNSLSHESIFHGTILFNNVKQFRRFLAYKEFYKVRGGIDTPQEFSYWKFAFRRAKEIMQNNCRRNNFMFQMTAANNSRHNLGNYQDETDHEC